jgi:hypothetical protein
MSNVSDPILSADRAPAPVLGDLPGLIRFAAAVTETLRLDDGVYCYDRRVGSKRKSGQVDRYTLMVALGFWRAEQAGYTLAELAELADIVLLDESEVTSGDRGLALWLLTRLGDARAESLVAELSKLPVDTLAPLEGMEIGWLVIGAAQARRAELSGADALHDRLLQVLRTRRAKRTPLYHHLGTSKGPPAGALQPRSIRCSFALAESERYKRLDRSLRRRPPTSSSKIRSRRVGPWLYITPKRHGRRDLPDLLGSSRRWHRWRARRSHRRHSLRASAPTG